MDDSSFNGDAQNVQIGGDDRTNLDSVQKKIYEYLMLRGQQQSTDISPKRMIDLTRFLDKTLFNAASSLDEYMNVDTLENRLIFHLKHLRNAQQLNLGLANLNLNQNQEENSITMIPTPGRNHKD